MRAQEDRQSGMDRQTACQLLIPQRDPRESAQQQGQQQGPRATWMELQMCLASDMTQELRMVTQTRQTLQISSFPHAASLALSLLLENTEMVALKEPTTVVSQVQHLHVALAEKVSPELAQVAQEFLATGHWLLELSAQTHVD